MSDCSANMQACNGRSSRALPGQLIPSHWSSQNASLSESHREDIFRSGTAPGLENQRKVNNTQSQEESVVFHCLKYPIRESRETKKQTTSIRLRQRPQGSLRISEPNSPSFIRPKALSRVEDLAEGSRIYRDQPRPPCRQSDNAYHLEDYFGLKTKERHMERRKVKVAFLRPVSPSHNQVHSKPPLSKDALEGLKLEDMLEPNFEEVKFLRTGPVAGEIRSVHREEDIEGASELRLATSRVMTAHGRKTMTSALDPKAFLRGFPVTLNKRKGSAFLCPSNRPSTRLPPSSKHLLPGFSKASPVPSRTQSSSRKASSILLTSLDPHFLGLFAAPDPHY
jgi:hypothetical protein